MTSDNLERVLEGERRDMARRKAVNTVLAEMLFPLIPDLAERTRVGNNTASLILEALSAIPVPSPMGEELLGAECDCAEVDGENPDCPVHELTIDRIARWEDWECTTTELDGFTARKVARKALGIKEVR